MDSSEITRKPPPSSLVTVVAWIFIAITGFSTVIGILQNIIISFFFPMSEMQNSMHSSKGGQEIPAFTEFLLNHFQLFFLAFFVLSVTVLISSIGLLKRKNWARIAFITFFAVGIAWNIAGLVFQHFFFSSLSLAAPNTPPEFRTQFETLTTVMFVFSVVMALSVSVIFGWLMKRFLSKAIKAEFGAGVR